MSESVGSSEFLLGVEEYLRYLNYNTQADSVHTLSRTISADDNIVSSVKAFMQDLGATIQEDDKDLADLLHGIVKSKLTVDSNKTLLQYLGKIEKTQELKDLIFSIIKLTNTEEIYKSLLQYINKKTDKKVIQDLIHGATKSNDLITVYKSVLQFVGKTIESNKPMADLALAIQRAVDSDNFEDDFIRAHLAMLDRQFLNDKIFRGINNCIKSDVNRAVVNDAFSRSQIRSKIWLMEELLKIDYNYDNVLVMAGWFGQLKALYEKKCKYAKMRIVEIDKFACETSDYIFNLSNLENYKVKSVHADINNLTLHKNGYEWDVENFKDGTKYSEKFMPDLIINTSAEHMPEDWFFQIKHKELERTPIVAIQSNNLFDIPEHINCVYSAEHMKKKFPMREILYEGELQLKGYKRVMLIGRP